MAGRPNSLPDSGTPVAVGKPLWDVKSSRRIPELLGVVGPATPARTAAHPPRAFNPFDPNDLERTVANRKSLEPRKVKTMNRRQRGGAILVSNVWYGTWRLDLPDGRRKPIKFRMGTREEIGFSQQEAYLALPNKLTEHLAALEEAEVNAEPKRQENKPKANTVPETFAELVEEWKQTEGQGIKKKSQNTFEHYTEALSAYFNNFNKKKLADIQRKDVVDFSQRAGGTLLRKLVAFDADCPTKDPQLRGAEPVHRAPIRMAGQNRTRRSSRSQGGEDGANCGAEPRHHPQAERAA